MRDRGPGGGGGRHGHRVEGIDLLFALPVGACCTVACM
jgi:hypothetical protein